MKIKIELFELKNLLIEAATLGAEAAEKRRSPTSDRMKERYTDGLKLLDISLLFLTKW